jgi:septation ring formation regulator EzrA
MFGRDEFERYSTREQLWIIYSQGSQIEAQLRELTNAIRNLTRSERQTMTTVQEVQEQMNDLTAQVARESDQTAAAIVFIHGLSDQLTQMANDAQSLDDLKTAVMTAANHVRQNADDIGAAIVTPGTQTP